VKSLLGKSDGISKKGINFKKGIFPTDSTTLPQKEKLSQSTRSNAGIKLILL